MYPINSAVLALFQSGARQYARITIGNDVITDSSIAQGGLSVNRYVETGDSLKVGSTVASELTLVLNNYNGTYTDYPFLDAEAYVEVGVKDSNNTIQYVPMGYFTFDAAAWARTSVTLTALDRMTKFDVVINPASLTFPTTVGGLLTSICTLCNVTLGQSASAITNNAVAIDSLPTEAKTYRDLLRWICEISGNNGYINYDGTLKLAWYSASSQFTIDTSNRKSGTLDKSSFALTGVIVRQDNTQYMAGTADRPIIIDNNMLISSRYNTVVTALGNKLIGLTYTPFEATVLPMPHLLPLDCGTFTRGGVNTTVYVTDYTFTLNRDTAIACKGNNTVRGRTYSLEDAVFYAENIAAGAITADKISVDDLASLRATIGGWDITATSIQRIVTIGDYDYRVLLYAPTNPTVNNAAFSVARRAAGTSDSFVLITSIRYSGKLLSTDADIKGTIDAGSGNIAGWSIGTNALSKSRTISGQTYSAGLYAPDEPDPDTAAIKLQGGGTTTEFQYDGTIKSMQGNENTYYTKLEIDGRSYQAEERYHDYVDTDTDRRGIFTVSGSELYLDNAASPTPSENGRPVYMANIVARTYDSEVSTDCLFGQDNQISAGIGADQTSGWVSVIASDNDSNPTSNASASINSTPSEAKYSSECSNGGNVELTTKNQAGGTALARLDMEYGNPSVANSSNAMVYAGNNTAKVSLWTRESATKTHLTELTSTGLSVDGLDLVTLQSDTITLTNGTAISGSGGCYWEKCGRAVHVHIAVSGLTAATNTTVCTLASGLRPSTTVFAVGVGSSFATPQFAQCYVGTGGGVVINPAGTAARVDFFYLV